MNSLLDRFTKTKKVSIFGKRWFQKTYGNTYHSAEIEVNDNLVHKIEFCYGYGSQYEWNAYKWLQENGYIKISQKDMNSRGSVAICLGRYCRENDIEFSSTVVDVKRKKDL